VTRTVGVAEAGVALVGPGVGLVAVGVVAEADGFEVGVGSVEA